MPTWKKCTMTHLNPPYTSSQTVFWVCGCLCVFHRDPIRTSNKTRQDISFCSWSSFHHCQGLDMISNKMFSLCSIASHGCSKGFPSVHTALQNNSFRPHIKLCVGVWDALLCWEPEPRLLRKTTKPNDVSLKEQFYYLCPQHLLLPWVPASFVRTINREAEYMHL